MTVSHLSLGVFPYTWLDDERKLLETQLPPRAAFYNDLAEEPCSPKSYTQAKTVFETFGCRSMDDYMLLYMATDIMLLASVYERFRRLTHATYAHDPARCVTYVL